MMEVLLACAHSSDIIASPVLRRHCRVLPQRSTEVSFASWSRSGEFSVLLARGKSFRGSETRHLATAHLVSELRFGDPLACARGSDGGPAFGISAKRP